MLKLRDEDKKLLFLIIIIGLVIFLIIAMDFLESVKVLSDELEKERPLSALEQAVQDIKLAPKNESDSFLRESVSKIFNLMNNKDFETLYGLLDEDFKEEFFHSSIDEFSRYMDQYARETYSPKYTKYEKYDNTYILQIAFLKYSENITQASNKVLKYDYFCIKKIDESTFNFAFSGFIGNKETNITVGNDLLKITLDESKLSRSSSSFIITLENLSEHRISIPSKQIYTVTGIKPKYYNWSVTLPPKETKQIQFTVYTGQSISSALPNNIIFPDIKIGEDSYSFTLPIEYCIDV